MIYFTAGLYLNDKDIANKRHYRNETLMNNVIISNWNYRVQPTDIVYIAGNVGDFDYLKTLNGYKYILLADNDKSLYNTYIESVTTDRDDIIDHDLFSTYCKKRYGVSGIVYDNNAICKMSDNSDIVITVDYENVATCKGFYLLGNIGSYQRLFAHGLNLDMYVNGMSLVSEDEVKEFREDGLTHLYF